MLAAPIPADEDARLADLQELNVSFDEPEEIYDSLTRDLARIFDVPVVVLSFIDRDTQYYKAAVGLPADTETRSEPRALSVCSHVLGKNEMLVVEDLLGDDRFRDNPHVLETGARFYAGAPLRADSGRAVGTLCILDSRPRQMTEREMQLMRLVAEGASAQVRLRATSQQLLERTLEVERDLGHAVEVQRFLLPTDSIEIGDWSIRHKYQPVERLGGDFLDVQISADGRATLLVADVTGHGTSAALTAAMLKTAFGRAAAQEEGPAAILTEIQDELSGVVSPRHLITALTAVFDGSSGCITISSAGHPYPLLIRDGEAVPVDHDNEFPLLVVPEYRYAHETPITLSALERLLVYTDGVIEARGPDGDALTLDGLLHFAQGAAKNHPQRFLDALLEALNEHMNGRVADDVALLSVEPR